MRKRVLRVEVYEIVNNEEVVLFNLDGLDVVGNVETYLDGNYAKGLVSIANLKKEHIDRLTLYTGGSDRWNANKFMRITAGYGNEAEIIIDGTVYKALPTMPPDVRIVCQIQQGYNDIAVKKTVEILERTKDIDVIKAVFSQYGYKNFQDYSTTEIYFDKFILCGGVREFQNKIRSFLANKKTVTYLKDSIIIDDFNAPKEDMPILEINKNKNMLFMPEPNDFGCNCTIWLDPSIRANQPVHIMSTQIAGINGTYYIYKITHDFESRGERFYTHLKAISIARDNDKG